MRKTIIAVIALGLTACGSFTTISKSDREIARNLKSQGTHCESIPRIYSGVAYDFCLLNSNPGGVYPDWFLGFYLFDGVVSAVADTVLLPYTMHQQHRFGSLDIQQ